MKILVVGDLHGEFTNLINLIKNNKEITHILQCGDFGCWRHVRPRIEKLNKVLTKAGIVLHWCDGNHEEFPFLYDNNMVTPNIIHQKRGSTITLPDGRVVLFIGGADSIDKGYRTAGYNWFPVEENITMEDIDNLPDIGVDVIIAHTAPDYFELSLPKNGTFAGVNLEEYKDNNRKLLNIVYNKYKPPKWYFGHFHEYRIGIYENCEWTMLSESKSDDIWNCFI